MVGPLYAPRSMVNRYYKSSIRAHTYVRDKTSIRAHPWVKVKALVMANA